MLDNFFRLLEVTRISLPDLFLPTFTPFARVELPLPVSNKA